MTEDRFRLENTIILSYAHIRSVELRAYFKATKDLPFDGLSNKYSNISMTRMQGSRYLIQTYSYDSKKIESYCADGRTMAAERLELDMGNFSNCFVKDEYMLVMRHDALAVLLKNLQPICQIEFRAKPENCKNSRLMRGRYAQQAGQSVYAVDKFRRLKQMEWQDIKDGKHFEKLVRSDVVNFYVDRRLGLATLNLDQTLTLPSLTEVDLSEKVDSEAIWTIVTCIANFWIVCGDRDLDHDGQAIMASINKKGDVRSILKLKLTSNSNKHYRDSRVFSGIFSLHQARIRRTSDAQESSCLPSSVTAAAI